ncbi:hypothetical protein [Labilibaculum antarcticum]|uniref:PKD domain-containing protein n=1 Tax=Labilibaculum antarcticum TaxID=1717717 RepID=A0A1Y1CEN3_9BACT|nr:hypothetical protein [Labilibaculum antarcticum]BAX78482.1 hypothetical protein ALGA_0087 [Labilibaculum antarcticum]
MKNIKFLFLFSVLAMLFACEADYEPLNDYSDVDWYTSSFSQAKTVAVGKYLSFSDLSQNAVDHSWSFSDTSGCNFLTGRIVRQDSTYTQFIDENIGNESTEKTVSIIFTKAGIQGVKLRNTFNDKVVFKGTDTLESVMQDGLWVIDTTFVVDVYDSIQSAFKVFYEDVELVNVNFDEQHVLADSSSWPVKEIMAGEALKFVDMTTIGRPDSRTWSVGGGNPATSVDSAKVVSFYKLGTYFTRLNSSRTGESIPGGYKMKYVPLKIKVIKSTLPFDVVGQATEANDETISISLTGEMVPFAGKEGDFTVHVTNGAFDQDIAVASASIKSTNGTVLELKLTEPIYNSDAITVTYVGGTIMSSDERNLAAFTTVVKMYKPNLVVSGGFEDAGINWVAGSDHVAANLNEYSTTDPATGAYCMHLNTVAAGRNSVINTTNFSVITGKQYQVQWKIKVVAATGGGYEMRINKGGVIDAKFSGLWTGYGAPDGVWKTVTKTINYTDASPTLGIQILSYHITETYWDDISFSEYEPRP